MHSSWAQNDHYHHGIKGWSFNLVRIPVTKDYIVDHQPLLLSRSSVINEKAAFLWYMLQKTRIPLYLILAFHHWMMSYRYRIYYDPPIRSLGPLSARSKPIP